MNTMIKSNNESERILFGGNCLDGDGDSGDGGGSGGGSGDGCSGGG